MNHTDTVLVVAATSLRPSAVPQPHPRLRTSGTLLFNATINQCSILQNSEGVTPFLLLLPHGFTTTLAFFILQTDSEL